MRSPVNKRHVIIGIISAIILAAVLLFVFSGGKPSDSKPMETQLPDETANADISVTDQASPETTPEQTETATETATAKPTDTPNPWKETKYPPTCENAGYTVRENTAEGYTIIEDGEPALGHEYSEWSQDPESREWVAVCARCGQESRQKTEYTETLPRIDLTGSMQGISKTDRITMKFGFTSPKERFTCYSFTTWQGHSTLKYPKKNYTVRLFDDETLTRKHRETFDRWQPEHKYVLKANYCDISQARNLIAAKLWGKMAACRNGLPGQLRKASNYGAVNGFPVAVYLNGDFHGLYTMNLHIDEDLYQMDSLYDAVMIANSAEPDETRFSSPALFEDEKNAWEVEYCGTEEDSQWAKDKLNELIGFVMTADDEAFRNRLGEYLDIDGAIDYLIFLYVTGLQNNGAKDLVLLKYQDYDAWIPTVYDLEQAFGLGPEGTVYLNVEDFLPHEENGKWASGTDSLLWDRFLNGFQDEIIRRYNELRNGCLSENLVPDMAREFRTAIPEEMINRDLELYADRVRLTDPFEQIPEYYSGRLAEIDRIWKGK